MSNGRTTVAQLAEKLDQLTDVVGALAAAQADSVASKSPASKPAATVQWDVIVNDEPRYVTRNGKKVRIGRGAEFAIAKVNIDTGEVFKTPGFIATRDELVDFAARISRHL